MKNTLLATTAIAMTGAIALPASAAEWDVKVSGYMEQYVAYANSNFISGPVEVSSLSNFSNQEGSDFIAFGEFVPVGEFNGIDSKQAAEIHFIPSLTLDNGIKIGANVQLAAGTSGDQIDESYMFIKGSFGEILLGSENSAGYKMTYGAPDVTFVNVNSGSLTAFIPYAGGGAGDNIFRGTLGSTFLENVGNNDAQRITYFTPRFSGFQLGVSYARDGKQDNNAQVDTSTGLNNIFDLGANYVNSFGGFDIAVSERYGIADNNTGSKPKVWSSGLNLGYEGVTVGGSYAKQWGAGTANGRAWDAGISYKTGPWGFSFTYMNGKSRGGIDISTHSIGPDFVNGGNKVFLNEGQCPTGCELSEIGDETLRQFLVGISYDMATGVQLNAFGAYVDFDDAKSGRSFPESSDGAVGTNNSVDGFVVGTGIKISF